MRLIFRTLKPFCIDGEADFHEGATGYADDLRTAEAIARAHELGYVALELGERAAGPWLYVSGNLPQMGRVLGTNPPTIEHVRRRYRDELFRKLSKLDQELLLADPSCPGRSTWQLRRTFWDWTPASEEAREIMAKLELLARRKLESLIKNHEAAIAEARAAVERNWASFEVAAERAEQEATAALERAQKARELAKRAAEFAKQKISAEEQARRDAVDAETRARGELVRAFNGACELLRFADAGVRSPVPGLAELVEEIRPKLQTATADESQAFLARLSAIEDAATPRLAGGALGGASV